VDERSNRNFQTSAGRHVRSREGRSAQGQGHSLRLLGHNAQEKLLILRLCVSSKLAHIARWGPADEYAEETEELNCAIERVVRDLAGAPSKELFPAEAMELARLPSSMGGMGLNSGFSGGGGHVLGGVSTCAHGQGVREA
jgi:hypothetical protein